jgi:hypothetical protein
MAPREEAGKYADVPATWHIHPTLTEALGEAALDGLGCVIHMPPNE